ncbi:hypothetical protein [Pectobacterium colocasium]|uniref:hypothetical protein n=1 Tax=Pectobacterium colocasium TaxID=2878098 RepID=UPI001CD763E1|nr:hypothetical protein [Pectobacterium colocasium]
MTDNNRSPLELDEIFATQTLKRERAEEKLKERLMKVTPKLFAEFLSAKGAAQHCLSCGSPALSVPESGSLGSVDLPENASELSPEELVKSINSLVTRYVTYRYVDPTAYPRPSNCEYRVSCINCGHVSFYRVYPVLKWIENSDNEADYE